MTETKVYIADIPEIVNVINIEEILPRIAPCYVKKYKEQKIREDALQELVTGLLLEKYLGIVRDEQLLYDRNGKPFPASGDKHFNVSHSGNLVVLAVSDHEVGIDTEKIMPFHTAAAGKVFDTSQNARLADLTGTEKDECFTRFWTEWEARLKLSGVGFSEGWEEIRKEERKTYLHTIRRNDYFITCAAYEEISLVTEHKFKNSGGKEDDKRRSSSKNG